MKLVDCTRSKYHGFHPEGEECALCEQPQEPVSPDGLPLDPVLDPLSRGMWRVEEKDGLFIWTLCRDEEAFYQ